MVRNKISMYWQYLLAIIKVLLCVGLSGCVLDGLGSTTPSRTFYHEAHDGSTAAMPLELSETTEQKASNNEQAFFDPWGQELHDQHRDTLSAFLQTSVVPAAENRAIHMDKLKNATLPQDILRAKKDYIYEGYHHEIYKSSQDNSQPDIKNHTDVENVHLDVFGAKLRKDFQHQLEQWLSTTSSSDKNASSGSVTIPALFRIFPDKRESVLMGFTEDEILSWLGKPDKLRKVGGVATWQYISEKCVLSVYLYDRSAIPPKLANDLPPAVKNSANGRIVTFAETYNRKSSIKACESG